MVDEVFRHGRHALAALFTALALLWLSVAAEAHASLVGSTPADGTVVASAPASYVLQFNEPVSPLKLTLVQPDGNTLSLDGFELKDRTLEIVAPSGLGSGTHVLSWRVVSEDGHPIGGSVVFSIGEPSARPDTAGNQIDWTVRAGLWTGKLMLYLGLFIGAGGVFALTWLIDGTRHGSRPVLAALGIGFAGIPLSVAFQGLDLLAAAPARILDPFVWSAAAGSSFGRTAGVALLALAAGGIALAVRGTTARLAALAAVLLAGTALALSGHASAANPQLLARPAVFLHTVTVALWTGALVPLGLALKRNDPRSLAALRRFSAAIPYAVAILVAAGIVLAALQIDRPASLTGTAYGRVFLVKLALLAALFALAAFNRWRLTHGAQAGESTARRGLTRSIAMETALVVAIFAAVACWRFTPPPRSLAEAAAQPESVHIHTEKAMAEITVTPGRAGPVDVSVIVMSGEFGPLDAKEIGLVFSQPESGIEPIRRPAGKSADGVWRAQGLVLPLTGTWQVRLDILISDFEMTRLEGELRLRP